MSDGRTHVRVRANIEIEFSLTYLPNEGSIGVTPHVTNRVDLTTSNQSIEIGMRVETGIRNVNGSFFVDANGLRTVERPVYEFRNSSSGDTAGEGMPVQGHFFPSTSHSFVQNQRQRLTVLSQQPQGVASLKNGEK